MSSAESAAPRQAPRYLSLAGSVLSATLLAGCVRPLYAPTTLSTQGDSVRTTLAAIDVPLIPDRMGHTMRNELVFLLEGRDNPAQKRYRLLVATNEGLGTAIVNNQFQRAEIGTLNGSANFRLMSLAEPARMIASGSVIGFASFENTPQRFANLRAIRDAQQRLAKHLAEQIHLQLATKLASPVP
jgi:LPS-assembly lipoprotein